MKFKLYAANLPDEITGDRLSALFAEVGAVSALELLMDETSGAFTGAARLILEADKPPEQILAEANNRRLGDQRVVVSPRRPREGRIKLTDDESQLAARMADTLGETAKAQRATLRRVVWYCGAAFAQAVLEETQRLEAAGGLLTLDGSRRRTPGGVYLQLVKERVTRKLMRAIFYDEWPGKKKRQAKPAASVTAPEAFEEAEREPTGGAEEVVAEPSAQDALYAAREQLAELRAAHQAAQDLLAAIKAGKADKRVGLFSTMQQVVTLQQRIDALLAEHPELA
jgi:hypothetical protein